MADWGVIPEETLFIDDMFANVAAAEALGFKGLHLTPEIDLFNALAGKLNI
jgi:FMN phosphatase YigB (HAD superfamily)